MKEQFLWSEKYRPTNIDQCILPEHLKSVFRKFTEKGEVPNLLLSGKPGIGKTTVAKALLNQLDMDFLMINGSLEGRNIDTLRTTIAQYASTVSFNGNRKYVILDEMDYLNPQSTQPALRNFMEEYSRNCGFIGTCNFKNKIIEPLHSRFSVVEFTLSKKDLPELAGQFLKRVEQILESEDIEYNKKVVAELIMKHLPDWRRVLNELQRYSATGKIDVGILSSFSDDSFSSLVKMLKEKDFTSMRKWLAENSDIETTVLYRSLYDHACSKLEPMDQAQMVMTLADYQYKSAFVMDTEINNVACLTELMMKINFK